MPLPKLNLVPSQASYSVADPDDDVLRAKVSAGPSRMRLDMLGAPSTVAVSFTLDSLQYQYWRAFLRTTLSNRSLPFLIDLILDSPSLTEHEAKIVPGSVRLSAQRGLSYTVEATLEVKPIDADADFDATLVWLYAEYGDNIASTFNALAELVNVHLPA